MIMKKKEQTNRRSARVDYIPGESDGQEAASGLLPQKFGDRA
jgi:hypothetical protein